MSARRALWSAVVIAAALATFQVPGSAQFPKPNPVSCPKGVFENDDQWIRRCREEEDQQYKEDADRRSRAMIQQIAATERQRAILEKQPPLPVSRNRLIGRWQTATGRPSGGDVFAQLAALASGCGVLIGDGIVSFNRPAWRSMTRTAATISVRSSIVAARTGPCSCCPQRAASSICCRSNSRVPTEFT